MRRGRNVNRKGSVDISFITEWNVLAGDTITLPTVATYLYNAQIDWNGEATTICTAHNTGNSYTFVGSGIKTITVTGTFEAWSFNNSGTSRTKITKIIKWGDVKLKYIQAAFHGCTNLTNITDLTPIVNNVNITSLTGFFRSCSNLTSVPDSIFSNLINVTGAGSTFFGSKITLLSANLFRYNIQINTFSNCFQACTSLTTIPSDLFRYNTLVTSFFSCFEGCSKITAIPSDLFRYNTLVTSFSSTFQQCSILASVPIDIFRYNPIVTNFSFVFYVCPLLTSIPNNLFYYNNLVTNYASALNTTRSITLPATIFNLSNLSIVTTFVQLLNVGSTVYSSTGIIQDIWNYTTATSTDAFSNQTALTNYAAIPLAWT